jgi:hypothetical protein
VRTGQTSPGRKIRAELVDQPTYQKAQAYKENDHRGRL